MLELHPAPGRLPPGERVYAIGDVHGCAAQLAALHRLVAADAEARPVDHATLVHLGDYVDRGPDSAGVLEMLLGPCPLPGAEMLHLIGNHEAMMLDALAPAGDPEALPHWLANGGLATLESYGIPPDEPRWAEALPEAHLALLRRLRLFHLAGDYLLVHAGISPGVALSAQDPDDLLWIREPFLSWEGDLPMVVVHGHSPAAVPEVRAHRIGIDTGCCFGGALTCLVLEADRLGFLRV